ncbi:MAG: hypothetical protein FWB71_04680 [Defluviitaleaceae bacterium]|nr:hypothetical protein [Defluviitaleaceae bacterium]
MLKAYWFNNFQPADKILQPDFFAPRTVIHMLAQLPEITYPIEINISAEIAGAACFDKKYTINSRNENLDFYIRIDNNTIHLCDHPEALPQNPERIIIAVNTPLHKDFATIDCEYATICGRTTDFSGKAFPAAIIYHMHTFDPAQMGMGVWSDLDGEYSISLPKGDYNAVFVDDKTYGQTTLEAWGWKMLVDGDEEHNFKIGNGEVYGMDVWANNGGFRSLFIYFRPMILSYCLAGISCPVEINGKSFNLINASPEISLDDINVTLNGNSLDKISLQKIQETGQDGSAVDGYILQTARPDLVSGKQTLILEYDFIDAEGKSAQGQGRIQFHFSNPYGLAVR